MEYKYSKCPVCGSTDIKILSQNKCDDNYYFEYKCNSCESIFDSLSLLKKTKVLEDQTRQSKELLSNFENKLCALKDEIHDLSNNPRNVFMKTIDSVVEIICDLNDSVSTGTGIIISENLVITNYHVVSDSFKKLKEIYCYKGNNKKIKLEILSYDAENDIAILKSKNQFSNYINIRTIAVQTGERCYTIGNAKGQGLSLFEGIVADCNRKVNDANYILFTAPVTTGNSGGPLLDSNGLLIGMVKMGRTDASSMNYAIPISVISNFIKEMM